MKFYKYEVFCKNQIHENKNNEKTSDSCLIVSGNTIFKKSIILHEKSKSQSDLYKIVYNYESNKMFIQSFFIFPPCLICNTM